MAVQAWHGEKGKDSNPLHSVRRTLFRCRGSRAQRAADGTIPGAASWERERNQRAYPVYPQHPLGMGKQGRGVYEIHVNKAGTVTEVKILKSSGDPTFDNVTVDTLHQWRLRNGPKIIELPLVFVMTPDTTAFGFSRRDVLKC